MSERPIWICTALPDGLKPLPVPSTVEPLGALLLWRVICALSGAATTVTATTTAAAAPAVAATSRIHVDRQGYSNAKTSPRRGGIADPVGGSVLMRTAECKSARVTRLRASRGVGVRCTVTHVTDDESRVTAEVMRAPLDAFVATRAEAVRRLRAQGEKEAAARINALRKPSVVLWALNQAGAVARDDVDALRSEGLALRAAQARVLSGDRTASADLQRATQDQRQRLDVLTRRLGMVLGAAGHAAPDVTIRRITDGLRAASIGDDVTWDALRGGRLLAEPEAATFPVLDVHLAPAAHDELIQRESAEQQKRRDAAGADVRRAEALLENAREQEAQARQRRAEAERTLDHARARLAEIDAAR